MAISLVNVLVRHARRVRVFFTTDLAAGAFTTTSFYTVTSLDDDGLSPDVVAAIAVPGATNTVELVLGDDLVDGGLYSLAAIGVPANDASVTPGDAIQPFAHAEPTQRVNEEVPQDDISALVFGVDLRWDGSDYAEATNGDLDTMTGPPNVLDAVTRACLSDGLAWNDAYGAKPRSYVDGPSASLTTLKGAFIRQAIRDDRVQRATCAAVNEGDGSSTFDLAITPVGASAPINTSVEIPTA